ncbi:MAG: response regulator [Elusimicrobiales bacterium]|nr:response regulator [Elusimicrobiales bacterium]
MTNRARRILCVDDEDFNLDLLEALLKPHGYETMTALHGREALEVLAAKPVDLVLLDINMPVMNGHEVCKKIKSDPQLAHIPVIMITSMDNKENKMKGMESGAEEFLSKPYDQAELLLRIGNILRSAEYEGAFDYLILALARAAEANDVDTGNHILRVAEYAALVARELGQSEKFIDLIHSQATLHDVGKVHIPSHILKKPGRLTAEEMEEMKHHTTFGAMIIGDHPHLEFGKRIALCHHERWDGTGYPKGLKGEEIPLEARITAICDCYDALRNSRVYKPNYDHEGACRIIMQGDDRMKPEHFDPRVMDAFKKLAPRFDELYKQMLDPKEKAEQ